MQGYPILTDSLQAKLANLQQRIARLEHPHQINYAQRFGWIARSSFTSQPQVANDYAPMDGYLGLIKGPSALYVLECNWGDDILWNVRYFQFVPTPANDNVVIANGTATSVGGPQTILLDTAAEGIEGTFGLLILEGKADGAFPGALAGFTVLDSGFITPEYEIITS